MADAVSRSSHKTPTHSDLIEQPRPVRLLGPLEPTSSATSGNGVETGNAGHAGRHGFLGEGAHRLSGADLVWVERAGTGPEPHAYVEVPGELTDGRVLKGV